MSNYYCHPGRAGGSPSPFSRRLMLGPKSQILRLRMTCIYARNSILLNSIDAEPKPVPKPLIWVGDSIEMVRSFPETVKSDLGVALYQAQIGGKHALSKPLHGIGPGALEIVSDHRGDIFRAIYTVKLAGRVYVLHAFQKKSKSGIATPQFEINLIKQRLKRAIEMHEVWEKQHG